MFPFITFQRERGTMSWEGAHILNPSLSKRRGASDLKKDIGCVWLLDRIWARNRKHKNTGDPDESTQKTRV